MAQERRQAITQSQETLSEPCTQFSARSRLKSCYLSLLASQDMEQIKVTKLCALAGMQRSAFHTCYHRLDDLVDDLFEDVLAS